MSLSRALCASLLATSCLLPVAAQAQEATSLPPVDVESAETGADSAAPLGGSQINRDEIRRRQTGTSDTADLLRAVPGVSANAGGGFSSMPAVRGMTEQRLRVVAGKDVLLDAQHALGRHLWRMVGIQRRMAVAT